MLNTITVIAVSKISSKKAIPKIAHNKAESDNLGLSEHSKLKLIMQLRNYASNGIIIKRLKRIVKRFLLEATGNDERTMVSYR